MTVQKPTSPTARLSASDDLTIVQPSDIAIDLYNEMVPLANPVEEDSSSSVSTSSLHEGLEALNDEPIEDGEFMLVEQSTDSAVLDTVIMPTSPVEACNTGSTSYKERMARAKAGNERRTSQDKRAIIAQISGGSSSESDADVAWMEEAAQIIAASLEAQTSVNSEAPAEAEVEQQTPEPIRLHQQTATLEPEPVQQWVSQSIAAPPDADVQSTEAEANAAADVNAAARELLRANLEEYVQRAGGAASYEGWIGVVHPENVDADGWIDPRLCIPGNEYLLMWAAATADVARFLREGAPAEEAPASPEEAPALPTGLSLIHI